MTYFLRRLLLFIPTILFVSFLIFSLLVLNNAEYTNSLQEEGDRSQKTDYFSYDKRIKTLRNTAGSDLPIFYFSIDRYTSSDTLYKINIKPIKQSIKSWSYQLASWEKSHRLFKLIKTEMIGNSDVNEVQQLNELLYTEDLNSIRHSLNDLQIDHQSSMFQAEASFYNYLPRLNWHGFKNQYHQWLKSVLQLDLGKSLISKEKVSSQMASAISWTVGLSLLALLLSILIAIPLSVYAAFRPNGWLDRFCSTLFFSLYSLPVFWVATLLLVYFASKEHLYWFPSFGVGEIKESMSFWNKVQLRAAHLALPLICWTYGSLAFIYRQLRSKISSIMKTDFILTAKAKGLNIHHILWKHAFQNSKFPLITYLGACLPALFTGSFVIESIFSIPGMGKLTIDAFLQRDYPLIYSICMLACILTILGIFLADLAYHYADPRLKLRDNND